MFAVIKTGGKQYRVEEGDVLRVESLHVEAGAGVAFSDVLLVGNGEAVQVGSPNVAHAVVAGEVVDVGKGRKVIVFKKKRRKQYRRFKGHRQEYTAVRIGKISVDEGVSHGA